MAAGFIAATASPDYNNPAADPSTAAGQLVFTAVATYEAPGTVVMPAGWNLEESENNSDGGRPVYLKVYSQLRTGGALTMAPVSTPPSGYLQTAIAYSGTSRRKLVQDKSKGFTNDQSVSPLTVGAVTTVCLGSAVAGFTANWDRGLISYNPLTQVSIVGTGSQEMQSWSQLVGHGSQGPFPGVVNPLNPNDTWVGISLAINPQSFDSNLFGI